MAYVKIERQLSDYEALKEHGISLPNGITLDEINRIIYVSDFHTQKAINTALKIGFALGYSRAVKDKKL